MIPPLLRENREFRRLFVGQAVSLFGDQVAVIALPLTAVLALHAGAAQMGYLMTTTLAPNLLFAMHAGALVDRLGRRRHAMLLADGARALLTATIPIAYAFGHLTFVQLYVVGFLIGTFGVVFNVASGALFGLIVEREDYVAGSSLLNGSRAFSYMAGPSAGGVLVQVLRGPYALFADALSFVWSAVFLGRMQVDEPPVDDKSRGVLSGARWLARSRVMRADLAATATINYFNFLFFALFILFATKSLHVHPAVLGLVLGAGAVGGLIGSFITGRVTRRIGIGPAFTLGCFLFPAPLLLVPAARGPMWVVLLCLFGSEFGAGFGVMILDISGAAITASHVPQSMRARVAGAFTVVNYGVRPLGTITAGILGSTIGLRPTLWIATIGALAGVLWLLPSPVPRLRELPAAPE
ncbi:MAG TPA: MFS transporter [Gaiellaceae bacterium]|nr:MFS transporter [Gaiellaceae bacterium]